MKIEIQKRNSVFIEHKIVQTMPLATSPFSVTGWNLNTHFDGEMKFIPLKPYNEPFYRHECLFPSGVTEHWWRKPLHFSNGGSGLWLPGKQGLAGREDVTFLEVYCVVLKRPPCKILNKLSFLLPPDPKPSFQFQPVQVMLLRLAWGSRGVFDGFTCL